MIIADVFPLPQRILTPLDPDEHERLAGFTQHQVAGAQQAAALLAPLWQRAGDQLDRVRALQAAHAAVVGWRYELALNSGGKHMHGDRVDRERFLIPIDDARLNWDRSRPTAKDGAGTPNEATTPRITEPLAKALPDPAFEEPR